MKFGIGVMCCFDDEAPEPEGTVLFEGWPKVDDEVVLCDGNIWIIIEIDDENGSSYPVKVKRKKIYVSN